MRSGKYYRANEREVMEQLGLSPVPGSGSGWIHKEDGENGQVLCQLKSTHAESISVKRQDLETLEFHAAVAHKIPVFAIQFLETDDVYLLVRPMDLQAAAAYLHPESTGTPDTEFQETESPVKRKKWKPQMEGKCAWKFG